TDLCAAGATADVVDASVEGGDVPQAAVVAPWTGSLPASVDLAALPMGPLQLVITASDGAPHGAGGRGGSLRTPAILILGAPSCDDGDPCTVDNPTDAGCEHIPLVCTGGDACHDAGTCNPATGQCVPVPRADETPCDDGNACTMGDTCQAGVCMSGAARTCTAPDACHVAGECNPATGECMPMPVADATPCRCGNACTMGDMGQAGVCTPGAARTCAAPDACHVGGECNAATGECMPMPVADGTTCSDGNACTVGDMCRAGVCTSGATRTCAAPDACHVGGECNPATGQCMPGPEADGAAGDDGDTGTVGGLGEAGGGTAGGARAGEGA